MPAQAEAEQVMTSIICNDPEGNAHDYTVGWDNSQEFFRDMGYIPRLWCEGGYAGQNYTYVSDQLSNPSLGWYSGVIIPVLSNETQTIVVDSSVVVPNNDSSSAVVQDSVVVQESVPVEESVPVLPDTQTVPVEETTVVQVDSTPTPPPPPPIVVPSPPSVEPEPPVAPEPEPAPVEPPPSPEPPAPPVEVPAEEPPPPAEEPPVVETPLEPSEPPVVEPTEDTIPDVPVQVIAEPTVTLSNGVVLKEEVAAALELFNNPSELLSEVFTNPGAVLTAFSNIGADMSPQVRDKAEKTIVAAVIVGQIATQSAVTASLGAAAYRRKP